MARPAQAFREAAQAIWPGASVVERGRQHIRFQHPTEPGRFMLRTSGGPLHYGPNADTEIDTAWTDTTGVWQHQMTAADFEARVKAAFNGAPLVEYRVGSDWVTLQPRQLEWHNDRNDVLVAGGVANVTASVTDDTLRWTNAYGTGRHFEYQAQTARLAKKIILDSYASLPTPSTQILTGGNPVLRAQFQFAWSSTLSVFVDGTQWTGGGGSPTLTTANHIEFRNAGGEIVFAFESPQTADADGDVAPGMLMRVSRSGPNILIETRTPQAWLQDAIYPVVIDPTITPQIGVDADDGAWREGNSSFVTNICPFGYINTTQAQSNAFFRFGVTIPAGATIDVSHLIFVASVNRSSTTHAIISAIDASNAAAPTTFSGAENATRTTASVAWNSIESWSSGSTYQSPSIVSVIQELVDDYSYASGAAMVIYVEDNGSSTTGSNNTRQPVDYNSSTTDAAILHIEYTEGGGGDDLVEVISEGVSLADANARLTGLIRTIVEAVELSEVAARARMMARLVGEQVDIAETAVRRMSLARIVSETVALAENAFHLRGRLQLVAETVGISETTARLSGMVRWVNETVQIDEATARLKAMTRQIDEALGISEAAARFRALARTVSEALNISETATFRRGLTRIANETVRITETALDVLSTVSQELVRVISEAVDISEATQRLTGFVRLVDEALHISETVTRARALTRIVLEALSVAETVAKAQGLVRSIVESVAASEAIQRLSGLTRIISESVAIAESIVTAISSAVTDLVRIVSEQVAVSETAQRSMALVRRMAETVGLTEAAQRAAGWVRVVSEAVNLPELARRIRGLSKVISESLDISETSLAAFGVAITELRVKFKGMYRNLFKRMG